MFRILKLSLVLFVFYSCTPSKTNEQKSNVAATDSPSEITYAHGFRINKFEQYTQITVRNPWDTTQTLETYILVPRDKTIPANLPKGIVVKVPVQRVGLCTSIFWGEYQQLGETDKVVALSELEYYDSKEVIEKVKNGKITDLGVNTNLNTEKVLASKLDILVLSPFEVSVNDRFKKNGICVVKDASYMEDSPLGRTEWIKFEAAFLDKSELANDIFQKIEKRYLDLCKLVPKNKIRPTIFNEKKFGDIWYTAGGSSYVAKFYHDAGANYVFSDLKNTGSVPYNFEKVYQRAINADFWIFKYFNIHSDMTLKALGEEYELYKNFKAFKNKKVYAVNSANTPYYEIGPLEPDVVLSDLIFIFHPDLLPNHKNKYFKQLQ